MSLSRFAGGLIGTLFILTFGAAIYSGWNLYSIYQSEFPDVAALKDRFPQVVYSKSDGETQVQFSRSKPESWVDLADVSKVAVGAIIVSEDWAFYSHKGYDPNQIKEALLEDLERKKFAFGASTITQQVVKNVFLYKEKSLWRKLREVYLAVKIEERVGKTKILETYLNIVELGEGIYGIKNASRLYFNKEPRDLSAKEGAFLAMLLPSPKKYSQSFRSRELSHYAKTTIDRILAKMIRANYLTEDEKESEARRPLSFESPSDTSL
ncbi:MAG: biosynthetic peptidoglycan transglycosylase [Bdellovibrionota bacterium]